MVIRLIMSMVHFECLSVIRRSWNCSILKFQVMHRTIEISMSLVALNSQLTMSLTQFSAIFKEFLVWGPVLKRDQFSPKKGPIFQNSIHAWYRYSVMSIKGVRVIKITLFRNFMTLTTFS